MSEKPESTSSDSVNPEQRRGRPEEGGPPQGGPSQHRYTKKQLAGDPAVNEVPQDDDAEPSTSQQDDTAARVPTETPINTKRKDEKLTNEDQSNINRRLFYKLSKSSPLLKKLNNITKCLEAGADVNAIDANDNNNTILHVSVNIDEPEVVKFILNNGAKSNKRNKKNETPLDLARALNKTHSKVIVTILESLISITTNNVNETSMRQPPKRQEMKSKKRKEPTDKLTNQSRKGTADIEGQLYESKLLALLLYRAMNNKDITSFLLGTNIVGVGAFDDIVFKYYLENDTTPRIVFVQAKHKIDPDKHKLTVEDILKMEGNYSVLKYFESYVNIKKHFSKKSDNDMFKEDFRAIQCDFIIYTSITEKFHKKEVVEHLTTVENILCTNENGTIFKFKYDEQDMDVLVKNVAISHTISLAKAIAKFHEGEKYKHMLSDELLRIYHVFFANNVFDGYRQKDGYLEANFSKSFLDTDDSLLRLLKDTICEELNIPVDNEAIAEGETTAKGCTFKLPINFGNLDWGCTEKEKSKEYYDDMCGNIKKLTEIAQEKNGYLIAHVNANKISCEKILTYKCVISIGRLVGNVLILDDKTEMLKFNTNETSMPKAKSFIDYLKIHYLQNEDLEKYRFDFNLDTFPKLALSIKHHIKSELENFLSHLKFFTSQAKEDKVEKILKDEIDSHHKSGSNEYDSFYRIEAKAIYLTYHDKVQQWWRNSDKNYLNKNCEFYKEANKEIVGSSPLITAANCIYVSSLKRDTNYVDISFNNEVFSHLGLRDLLNTQVIHITTNDKLLSSKKLIKYFQNDHATNLSYAFLDIYFILGEGCDKDILSELTESKVYIIIFNEINDVTHTYWTKLYDKIKENDNSKIIVVTSGDPAENELSIEGSLPRRVDENNSLNDFDSDTVERMIQEKLIVFQGYEVTFDSIISKDLYHLVKDEMLHKFIKGGDIEIGRSLRNEGEPKSNECYIERRLMRYVWLIGEAYRSEFHVFDTDQCDDMFPEDGKDIVVISEDRAVYKRICGNYENSNIHWFYPLNSVNVWKESKGNISKIVPHVSRGENMDNKCCEIGADELQNIFSFQPQTLIEKNEILTGSTIIIRSVAGMGKSTLLNHLMYQTKEVDKSCIIKVNLTDYTTEFSQWQNNQIDFKQYFMILCKAFCAQSYKSDGLTHSKKEMFDCLSYSDVYIVDKEIHFKAKFDTNGKIKACVMLQIHVLIQLYNKGDIILVLDGFDEISPHYSNEVLKLIEIFMNSRIRLLWIASRSYNILNKLENQVNTFSFTLKPLSPEEQQEYLKKKLFINDNSVASEFLEAIATKLNDVNFEFLSIPLHLYMISEIYKDCNNTTKSDLIDFIKNFNLHTLYEKFVEVKFYKIRFGDKSKLSCSKNPDIIDMIEEKRQKFVEDHKKMAAFVLLDQNHTAGLFTELERQDIGNLIEEQIKSSKEKTGITDGFDDEGKPNFVHYSYAEYFAAEFLCEKLKSESAEPYWSYFINNILVEDRRGLRDFIECKLKKDKYLFKCTSFILDYLLLQRNNSQTNALFNAVYERLINLTDFLLRNVEVYLKRNTVNDFIDLVTKKCTMSVEKNSTLISLSATFANSDPVITKQCTVCYCALDDQKIVIRINDIIKSWDNKKMVKLLYCEDIPECNLLSLAFLYGGDNYEEIFYVLDYADPQDIANLFSMHFYDTVPRRTNYRSVLQTNLNYLNVFERFFRKLNKKQLMTVFSAKDREGRLLAHDAAEEYNFKSLNTMSSFLDESQMEIILKTEDNLGATPWSLLHYPHYETNYYRRMLQRDYSNLSEFEIFLRRLNREQQWTIFYGKDGKGRLMAHDAAEENLYKSFKVMASFLDQSQMGIILNTADNDGNTALSISEYPFSELNINLFIDFVTLKYGLQHQMISLSSLETSQFCPS